jgi:hypothetical protein
MTLKEVFPTMAENKSISEQTSETSIKHPKRPSKPPTVSAKSENACNPAPAR